MPDTNPNSYKSLLVWQKGMELAKQAYQLTETFLLLNGMAWSRRCAVRVFPYPPILPRAKHAVPGGNSFSSFLMPKAPLRSWRHN